MTGLSEVDDFTPLISQKSIERLFLHDCKNLRSMDELRSLPKLRSLSLGGTSLPPDSLTEIAQMWPRLKLIQLQNEGWVTSLEPIRDLPLEILSVPECSRLKDISLVAGFTQLKSLFLSKVPFDSLDAITGLTNLNLLNLWNHDRFIDMEAVASLPRLRKLILKASWVGAPVVPLHRPMLQNLMAAV